MKKLIIVILAFSGLLLPFIAYPQSETTGAKLPPVEQNLVPEGEFALRLVPALKMGTTEDEAEAIDMLSSVGITPRNGWIANYPVTPDIVGELENTILVAADGRKLPIGKDEALKAFQDLKAEFGLDVASESSDEYAQTRSGGYAESPDSTVINNYYYDVGPPVVSYYPPPWDYYYLYAWVPYPFWWHGFHFGGFFVLHDFHRVVIVKKRPCVVTNHVRHPVTKKVAVIDPAKRRSGDFLRDGSDRLQRRGFGSPEVKKGAESIVERSRERKRFSSPGTLGPTREGIERNSPWSGGKSGKENFNREGRNASPRAGPESSGKQIGPEQGRDKGRFRTDFRGGNERASREPGRVERRRETDSSRPSVERGRSFTTGNPSRERSGTGGRPSGRDQSFSAQSRGQRDFGRSSGAPSQSFRAVPRGGMGSAGEFQRGGGRSSGSRGFAGGGARGGCRGRC